MRVVISTAWLGGIGGIERNVMSTIRALEQDEVDVCAVKVIGDGFYARPARGRIVPRVRWDRPDPSRKALSLLWPYAAAPIRYRPKPYDIYLHYFHGRVLDDRFESRLRLLVPAGSDVRALAPRFDRVLLEAPSNAVLVDDETHSVLCPPPIMALTDLSVAVPGLPADFLLTVMNPYSAVKGADMMLEVAEKVDVPIVWCYDTRTVRFPAELYTHRNIVPMEGLDQPKLRFLYESCAAYVSFSRSEGFGWAIADALLYGAPVVSRRTGVLTIPGIDLRGVHFYETLDELLSALRENDGSNTPRAMERFGLATFRARLNEFASAPPTHGQ